MIHDILIEHAPAVLALIAFCLSATIFIYSYRLYKISQHKGIGLLTVAFIYYTIGFFLQTFILSGLLNKTFLISSLIMAAMMFCLSIGGFYLVYSLVWKESKRSAVLLHLIAAAITVIDLIWWKGVPNFLVLSQILIFSYSSILGYSNYQRSKRKKSHNFSQLYFIAMVLILIIFILEYLNMHYIKSLSAYIQMLIIAVLCLFLYGTFKVVK